jgi:hypothetical protein
MLNPGRWSMAVAIIFGLVVFLPTARAEEQFEVTFCYSGTFTPFHDSKDLTVVRGFQLNGITRSHSENKFLDNATYHMEGVHRGPQLVSYVRFIDPDGDILIVERTGTGKEAVGKFLEGTGKYKGIKGSFRIEIIARGKPAMPGTVQECHKAVGTFELRK